MAAPAFASIGTLNSGVDTPRIPGVPSGVAIGNYILGLLCENMNNAAPAVPTGDGFASRFSLDGTNANQYIYDKIAAAADTGTYSFAQTTAGTGTTGTAQAVRFTGVDPTTPVHPFVSSVKAASSAASPVVALDGANAPPVDSLLLWINYGRASRTMASPPSGFIRISAVGNLQIHMAVKVHAGGNTGNVSSTLASATEQRGTLMALLPVAAGGGLILPDVAVGNALKTNAVWKVAVGNALKSIDAESVIVGNAKKSHA